MGGLRRKSLSIPPLLLLLSFLLLSPLPSLSQAQHLHCFVCDLETNPKCEEALSPSDTELIQECPKGKSEHGRWPEREIPIGCQVLIVHSALYQYPRNRIAWRGCLYSEDLRSYHGHSKDFPWFSGKEVVNEDSSWKGEFFIRSINEDRDKLKLPRMPKKDYFHEKTNFVFNYFIHKDSKHWNVSNGVAAATLFPAFKLTPMRKVQCFVCTQDDPGCEGPLTPSSLHFIQDCAGSEETTVPIGCQVIAGQYEYPHKTFFYRDCLYENYLGCHQSGYEWSDKDGWRSHLSPRVNCLNKVRSYLGLQDYKGMSPYGPSKPATVLYFLSGEPEPGRGHGHMIKYLNQLELSNGGAINGLISKQPVPPDFKLPGPFSCHTCDTSTQKCGSDKNETIHDLPQQKCNSPHDDAYGCMMIWKEGTVWTEGKPQNKTQWLRRGCWYKGDLFCLRKLDMPVSFGRSSTTADNCLPTCEPRRLVHEGQTAYWEDLAIGYAQDKEAHEKLRSCMKDIRQRLGVTDNLPELPGDSGLNIRYSFCAGRTLCNDKKTDEAQIIIAPNATCEPDDEPGYPCRCEGPNCIGTEDTGWPTYVMVLIGVIALLIGIGVGVWVFSYIKRRRGERAEAKLPEENVQSVPDASVSQPESNGSIEVLLSVQLDTDKQDGLKEMSGIPL